MNNQAALGQTPDNRWNYRRIKAAVVAADPRIKAVVVATGVILFMFALGSFLVARVPQRPAQVTAPEPEAAPPKTTAPTQPEAASPTKPSLEEQAWAVIDDVRELGGWILEGKVRDIEVHSDLDSDKKAVLIIFDARQYRVAENILPGAMSDVHTLGTAFKAANLQEMGELRIVVSADFADIYGEMHKVPIIVAGFSDETLQKIRFDNVSPERLVLAADEYTIHPKAIGLEP